MPSEKQIEAAADQISEGLGAFLRKFCDSEASKRARYYLHEMPKDEWNQMALMLATEALTAAEQADYERRILAALEPAEVGRLVKRLRGVDHMSVEDCFLQSPLFGHAADKLEELAAALAEARKALEASASALDEAREDVEHWGSYAGEYFQNKHDLEGDLDRIAKQASTARRALAGGQEDG